MTMRWGWNAVAEIGDPRFCPRKDEYGSTRLSSLPWKLKTLTMWADVPLEINQYQLPEEDERGGGRRWGENMKNNGFQ